jgi:hypothetical protein
MCRGESEVALSLSLLRSYTTRPSLHWLAGRIRFLTGHNGPNIEKLSYGAIWRFSSPERYLECR